MDVGDCHMSVWISYSTFSNKLSEPVRKMVYVVRLAVTSRGKPAESARDCFYFQSTVKLCVVTL